MSKAFLLIPLRKRISECMGIELPITAGLRKYLAERFHASEVFLDGAKAPLISCDELNILIIEKDGIEDFESFYDFLSESYAKLRQYEPDPELTCVVYLTDSAEKFWNTTRFKGDPEMREIGLKLPFTDSEVLMGIRRMGVVVRDGVDYLELSSLLLSASLVTTYLAWKLLNARMELESRMESLKRDLTQEDYDRLASDIVSFSKVTSEYVFLRHTKSELCTKLILEYRRACGIDQIWDEVRMKLDTLRDYISTKLSLRAESNSAEILEELESVSRISMVMDNVMNVVNVIAAASISLSFSESISRIFELLPPGLNQIFWGGVLLMISFLSLSLLKMMLEKRSLPLARRSFERNEVISLFSRNCKAVKFERILSDISGSRRRIVWRRGNVLIFTLLDSEGRITGILCERSGGGGSIEDDVCSLLSWLKSSGILKEGRIDLNLVL